MQQSKTNTVPRNVEAERALIGAVLIMPEMLPAVSGLVSAQDFFLARHQKIWRAITTLYEKGESIDAVSVVSGLGIGDADAKKATLAYLVGLTAEVPSSANAETYAELVADAAARRRALAVAEEIARAAYDSGIDIAEAAGHASDKLLNVSATGVQDAIVGLDDTFNAIMGQKGAGVFVPVSLGNDDLSNAVSAEIGTLNLVAARPGTGKTAYLLNVAIGSAKRGTDVVFLSGEMPVGQISSRLLAILSGVAAKKINKYRGGKAALSNDDLAAIKEAREKYADAISRIHVVDATGMSWGKAMAAAAVAVRKTAAKLLLVDYLGIFLGRVSREYLRHGSVLAMTYISNSAKQLAGRLGVMLIAAHQLNRAVEQRADPRPVLSDLRDSGALEQDADTVLFLYLPKDAKTPADGYPVMFSLAKNRHGAITSGAFFFMPRIQRFARLKHQEVNLTLAAREDLPL